MDHDAGTAGGIGQLDWLPDDLVRRVGHVTKAVIPRSAEHTRVNTCLRAQRPGLGKAHAVQR